MGEVARIAALPRPRPSARTAPSLRAPLAVAAVALALYAAWIGAWLATGGHNASDFIYVGERLVTQSHASAVIKPYPGYHYVTGDIGYDGQLYYFLALDPANARYYMDTQFTPPDYRYERILYPLAARTLALGQPQLVPYALILVNWLAVGAGALLVALWLQRKGISSWLALIYALCPGTFSAVSHDLAEPLAYALVALAVYLYDFGGARRLLWSALAFALAVLTRETTAVFALVYGAALLFGGETAVAPEGTAAEGAHNATLRGWPAAWRGRLAANWRRAATFLALALGPFAAYRVFLRLWLGPPGLSRAVLPDLLPYHGLLVGLLAPQPWSYYALLCLVATAPSALICLGMAGAGVVRRVADPAVWALVGNLLLFSVWLGPLSYEDPKGAPRYAVGILLAAFYSVPAFDRLTGRRRTWLVTAAAFWLLLLPLYVLRNG